MRDPDFVGFVRPSGITRRDFVMTTRATGFAAAVQPVAAGTRVTTDAKGLAAGEVRIPVKDGEIPAYRAMPEGGKSLPTVLVVQVIFGVHEHIKDVCRRLAKAGCLAIAPELYARQGDVSRLEDRDRIRAIVAKVPDAQVMADLDAAAASAAAHGGADPGIPNDTVDRMREALRAAGRKSQIHTYPDMPHAFHADYRPSYRKEAAEDGWRRLLAWFRQHGVA